MSGKIDEKKESIGLYRNNQEMVVDAFDRVVVTLFRENHEHGSKTFLICGCNAGVGTTSISMELAISLSVSGWNTVLVDGDLRKENRYKNRNQKVKYGLSDYIDGPADMEEILYPTNWRGLTYISCGHQESETPVKLLCSQRMSELMVKLKERFDFVIFDIPALNTAPDAAIVGAETDGTFLVAASGQTKFHDLETAKKQLEDMGAHILGVILNRVSLDDYRYYMEDYNYFNDKEYLKRSRYFRQKEEEGKPKKRKTLREVFKNLLGCLVLVCAVSGTALTTVDANEAGGTAAEGQVSEAPVVVLDGYHIDGPIVRGKEFTLSFTVRNTDPTMDVTKLKIGLHATSGGYFLTDTESNQVYVDLLPAGESYQGEFTLQALEGLSSEAIPIEFTFEYTSAAGSGSNTMAISPAVGQQCEIQVMSLVTSQRAVVGAKAFFSIQYKNSGLVKPASLSMRIRGNVVSNDEEISLKIPEPGRQEYVESSLVFTDAGSQILDVYLSYTDDDGVLHELDPMQVSTDVISYSADRDVYGTDLAWSEDSRRLVQRTDFMSMLEKIQIDYGWVVWIAVIVLVLDSLRRLVRLGLQQRRTAKARKKEAQQTAGDSKSGGKEEPEMIGEEKQQDSEMMEEGKDFEPDTAEDAQKVSSSFEEEEVTESETVGEQDPVSENSEEETEAAAEAAEEGEVLEPQETLDEEGPGSEKVEGEEEEASEGIEEETESAAETVEEGEGLEPEDTLEEEGSESEALKEETEPVLEVVEEESEEVSETRKQKEDAGAETVEAEKEQVSESIIIEEETEPVLEAVKAESEEASEIVEKEESPASETVESKQEPVSENIEEEEGPATEAVAEEPEEAPEIVEEEEGPASETVEAKQEPVSESMEEKTEPASEAAAEEPEQVSETFEKEEASEAETAEAQKTPESEAEDEEPEIGFEIFGEEKEPESKASEQEKKPESKVSKKVKRPIYRAVEDDPDDDEDDEDEAEPEILKEKNASSGTAEENSKPEKVTDEEEQELGTDIFGEEEAPAQEIFAEDAETEEEEPEIGTEIFMGYTTPQPKPAPKPVPKPEEKSAGKAKQPEKDKKKKKKEKKEEKKKDSKKRKKA